MTTVSVSKRAGFTPFFQRSFDDVSEAARFADSWRPMHVTIQNESGQALDPSDFIRCKGKPDGSALRPFRTKLTHAEKASEELVEACLASVVSDTADLMLKMRASRVLRILDESNHQYANKTQEASHGTTT